MHSPQVDSETHGSDDAVATGNCARSEMTATSITITIDINRWCRPADEVHL